MGHRNQFILDVNQSLDDHQFFHSSGDLNGTGIVKYWRALDALLQKFDKYKISLRPVSQAERDQIRKKKEQEELQQHYHPKNRARGHGGHCQFHNKSFSKNRY